MSDNLLLVQILNINLARFLRAFFTMDPQNGSISRAMKNRSVEISHCCYLPELDKAENEQQPYNWTHNFIDTTTILLSSDRSVDECKEVIGATGLGQNTNEIEDLIIEAKHEFSTQCHTTKQLLQYAVLLAGANCSDEVLQHAHRFSHDLTSFFHCMKKIKPVSNRLSTSINNCLILRPSLSYLTRDGFHKNFAAYYWNCWKEIAKMSTTPVDQIAALLMGFLFNSDSYIRLDDVLFSDFNQMRNFFAYCKNI